MLEESSDPLWERYDLAVLDLDGVVYIGAHAVPDAPQHLADASEAGMHLAFVTNNASRTPDQVAEHLTRLGIRADPDDVVTSAQAAARLVAGQVPDGAAVFVIGGHGLCRALAEHGLRPVQTLEDESRAVVSGYHPDLAWGTVVSGAILVARGLPWVASNTDLTIPTPHGPGPGNGVLVGAVARFAGREPEVAGKPHTPLFEETLLRVPGRRPLVVGDRLDTDIEGAVGSGLDSLLVMTGVTGVRELVGADPRHRPTYLAADLGGLGRAHPAPDRDSSGAWTCGGWTARVEAEALTVSGQGSVDDWWRVVAACGWDHADTSGEPADTREVRPPGSVDADGDQGEGR